MAKYVNGGGPYQAVVNVINDHPATYAVWGKIYRTQKLGNIRFQHGKRAHEDSFFLFECIINGLKFAECDVITVVHTANPDSATKSNFSDKYLDILDLADKKYNMIIALYPEYKDKAKNVLIKANMAVLGNLLRTNDIKYRNVEKKCISVIKKYNKYFVPASEFDAKMFLIIKYNLYRICKLIYRIKR